MQGDEMQTGVMLKVLRIGMALAFRGDTSHKPVVLLFTS